MPTTSVTQLRGSTGTWETIRVDNGTGEQLEQFHQSTVSADDVGCCPGDRVLLVLRGADDAVLAEREVIASGTVTVQFDPGYDLAQADEMLSEDVPDDRLAAVHAENQRRIEICDTAFRAAVRAVAAERGIEVLVRRVDIDPDRPPAPDTGNDRAPDGFARERDLTARIWQQAQDRVHEFIPDDQKW